MGRALLFVWILAAVLLLAEALGIGLMRDTDAPAPAGPSFYVPLLCAAVAAAVALFWHPQERLTWAVLAVGLTLGAVAEPALHLAQQTGDGVPPAVAVVYGLYCVACSGVVLASSGAFNLRRTITQGLGVCVFGLATVWSWLFLAPAAGSGNAVHGALDLVLALAVLVAFCNHGWPPNPRFAMLAAGLGLLAVADSMQAQGILTAVSGLDVADVAPFAGAALIAVAACDDADAPRR
ncbi:MAG TPA: hypothetical protein VLC07_06935, partial [Solirubrobacterales bacterium]|nr:hypothetical protein [Solirubrobacterales bacterium]